MIRGLVFSAVPAYSMDSAIFVESKRESKEEGPAGVGGIQHKHKRIVHKIFESFSIETISEVLNVVERPTTAHTCRRAPSSGETTCNMAVGGGWSIHPQTDGREQHDEKTTSDTYFCTMHACIQSSIL